MLTTEPQVQNARAFLKELGDSRESARQTIRDDSRTLMAEFGQRPGFNGAPDQLQRMMKHSDFSTKQGDINYAKLMAERPDVFVPDVLTSDHGTISESH